MNESSLKPVLDNLRNANDRYNCNKLDRRKTRFHFDFNPLFQFIFSLFFLFLLSFPSRLIVYFSSPPIFSLPRAMIGTFLQRFLRFSISLPFSQIPGKYRFINIKHRQASG